MKNYKELQKKYRDMVIAADKADKYSASGIYCIKIDEHIVYIGKSKDMFNRICAHMGHINEPLSDEYNGKKYRMLREAQKEGHQIGFDVLFYCAEPELDMYERKYITEYQPLLNTMIPSGAEKMRRNTSISTMTLPQLLGLLEETA